VRIIIVPGDGIGPELAAATEHVLQEASDRFDLNLELVPELAGLDSLKKYETTVRDELLEIVKDADGLLLGPMATYEMRDEAIGEINPSMYFRKNLDLFGNIRPARTFDGLKAPVGPFDLVVVRENTEGFYADRNMARGSGEILVTDDVCISMRRITRECCSRIARLAFELAETRSRKVSAVHKANVLKIGDGMFLEECRKVAREFQNVEFSEFIVDAMMAHVVRSPKRFDVIVTTNMFGDILSDLTAELSGSIGLGGSLNAGKQYAMGQAAHGSAPDIAGQDRANPASLILSAAMLLAWHGEIKNKSNFVSAAQAIQMAVEECVGAGEMTDDVGGRLGTAAAGRALAGRVAQSGVRTP
jgi:3-isopropylmalate dehydrogenase